MEVLWVQKRWTIKKKLGLRNFNDWEMGGLVVYSYTSCNKGNIVLSLWRDISSKRELWGSKGKPWNLRQGAAPWCFDCFGSFWAALMLWLLWILLSCPDAFIALDLTYKKFLSSIKHCLLSSYIRIALVIASWVTWSSACSLVATILRIESHTFLVSLQDFDSGSLRLAWNRVNH